MDERIQLAEYVYNLGRALWSMALHGGKPLAGELICTRMRDPRPGDLVIEVSGFRRTFDPDAVGRLLRIDGDGNRGDGWVIEPLHRPGQELRWDNAEFVAVPDIASVDRWSGLHARREAEAAAREAGTPAEDLARVGELVSRSSLGRLGARQLQQRTSPEDLEHIRGLAEGLKAAKPPAGQGHKQTE